MRIQTVLIETDNGPVIINKSAFDPAIHTLADAGDAAIIVPPAAAAEPQPVQNAQSEPPAVVPPAPVTPIAKPLVAQFGERFFIVNATGEKLSGKGISATGYTSNEKAWEAVSKLSE